VYFVKLYMFWAYLGPSSGVTTACIQQLVLIIVFRRMSVALVGLQSNQHNRHVGVTKDCNTVYVKCSFS